METNQAIKFETNVRNNEDCTLQSLPDNSHLFSHGIQENKEQTNCAFSNSVMEDYLALVNGR
ncbi:hypothetical protein ILUMI_04296 [Ignelater luminosus]|uniref:Uncharacterized protein n=1 Tax=Ignelater luminosus TaxID=2038154 RepID=A0A8K0D986_IGNLU|nr:hypothetical protein ILUMI_04296 [Ignelater luminosus]